MGKTILCIEDDRFIGEMYIRSLKKAGYDVDWVTDGNDGLVAAENKHYDVILIDIMLPNKKGDDILNILRNDREDKIPGTKVMILTNYQQDADSRLAVEKKVDAYMIKADITPKKLLQIIDEMSGGSAN